MSIEEDRLLLEHYVVWLQSSARNEKDISIDAFLAEREDRDNRLRITYAIDLIGDHWPPDGYQDLDIPNDHMYALDILAGVRDALTTHNLKELIT